MEDYEIGHSSSCHVLEIGSHVLKGFESHVAKEIVQAAVKNILETSNIQNLIQNDEHVSTLTYSKRLGVFLNPFVL